MDALVDLPKTREKTKKKINKNCSKLNECKKYKLIVEFFNLRMRKKCHLKPIGLKLVESSPQLYSTNVVSSFLN